MLVKRTTGKLSLTTDAVTPVDICSLLRLVTHICNEDAVSEVNLVGKVTFFEQPYRNEILLNETWRVNCIREASVLSCTLMP